VFGSLFVPLLALTPQFAEFGWRLLAIAVASELAYLAFLGAQATKVAELVEIVDEIERTQAEITAIAQQAEKPAKTEDEDVLPKTDRLTRVVNNLEARAVALCRQLGFISRQSVKSLVSKSGPVVRRTRKTNPRQSP